MKKILMVVVTGALYASFLTNGVIAQKATNTSLPAPAIFNGIDLAEEEKPASTNLSAPVEATLKEKKADLKAAKANVKVNNHLNRNFKNVSGLNWSSEEKVTIATFKMNDKSGKVVYDKRGNWLYTIITYYEDQMPENIKSLVNDSFSGFAITMVHEVSQGDVTLYKVHLEDCTSYKQVLVCNGEVTIYKEFQKSK